MKNIDVLLICVGAVGFAAVILAQRRYLKMALAVIRRQDKASEHCATLNPRGRA